MYIGQGGSGFVKTSIIGCRETVWDPAQHFSSAVPGLRNGGWGHQPTRGCDLPTSTKLQGVVSYFSQGHGTAICQHCVTSWWLVGFTTPVMNSHCFAKGHTARGRSSWTCLFSVAAPDGHVSLQYLMSSSETGTPNVLCIWISTLYLPIWRKKLHDCKWTQHR